MKRGVPHLISLHTGNKRASGELSGGLSAAVTKCRTLLRNAVTAVLCLLKLMHSCKISFEVVIILIKMHTLVCHFYWQSSMSEILSLCISAFSFNVKNFALLCSAFYMTTIKSVLSPSTPDTSHWFTAGNVSESIWTSHGLSVQTTRSLESESL